MLRTVRLCCSGAGPFANLPAPAISAAAGSQCLEPGSQPPSTGSAHCAYHRLSGHQLQVVEPSSAEGD
ncbi:hypothetical protein NDU88_005928 [Pleurodeles waltl]|uniref:Uncharacterized protein n=1 Tax=Pleurodeles waltl TaxID=8319 RepID=A0AAV7QGK7_PLEWA|nr:hypothetical protein NDU88_005928 [Pleurodeles waltl]